MKSSSIVIRLTAKKHFTFYIQYCPAKVLRNAEYSRWYCVTENFIHRGLKVFFHLLSDTKGGAKKSRLPKTG